MYGWSWCYNDMWFLSGSSTERFIDFKIKNDGFNILGILFWCENRKCYELKKVMKQNDLHFINILNRFWISSQTNENINFINNICLKPPPMDNALPHLFYTNLKITSHNKTLYERFLFVVQIVHFETCASHFKLPIFPNHIGGFIMNYYYKKIC
jgi:hypothetical protein